LIESKLGFEAVFSQIKFSVPESEISSPNTFVEVVKFCEPVPSALNVEVIS
tara:strand:- start:296 stop:448 length:153 start_codon:yes stop_codon:yes gene_type:complete